MLHLVLLKLSISKLDSAYTHSTTVKDVQTREECSSEAVKQCKKVMVKVCH
jgi:hypothetical protein